jgi:hypothetical protein
MNHSELIRDMLDNIHTDSNAEAQQNFSDLISMKLTDALDQRKMEIAQQIGAHNVSVQADS